MRLASVVMAALGVVAANLPVAAQNSRSLQDMLLVAIRLGDVAAVRSILTAGADVVKRGNNGKTAIDVAVDLGRFEIAELLVGERRRQRDAGLSVMAQSLSDAPRAAAPNGTPPSEVIQRSAEAAPEIVATVQAPAPLALAPISPVGTNPNARVGSSSAVNSPSVDQLLAVAQQLTLAAQAMANVQRPAPIAVETRPVRLPQTVQAVDLDFIPKPGRKPAMVEQASLAVPAVRAATPARDTVPPETVVVRPRRLTAEEEADRLRRELEQDPDLPAIAPVQSVSSPPAVTQPKAVAATKAASNAPPRAKSAEATTEESSGDLMRAVRGIGGFLRFGGEPKKAEQPATIQPSSLLPREHQKRDRSNVPHVPARRASDLQSNAVEPQPIQSQPSMPPVAAIPVVPVTELPPPSGPDVKTARLTLPRKGGGLNPFDPDNLPQGAVLPLTDPLAGNAPEVSRARAPMPDLVALNQSPPPATREPIREQQPKAPQRVARPAPAVPEVPPLADATKSSGPTAMFERRTQQMATAKSNKAADEGGILKNLATAVGLNESEPDVAENGFEPSDAERLAGRRMPIVSLRVPLADIGLSLGNSVTMDQRPLPRGVAEPDPCIKRSGGSIMFCVVPVDWHPRVDPAFSITTYLYQGSRAIARYDGGKATHYHTLFGSHQYDDVVKYFVARYGPPTDEWKRTISPFDRPRQANPTMVWRARDTKTNRVTILEVRRYDDTRNVFPDMEHGAVRLYAAGAQRVFPVITGMDLMAIDWAARSDHNNDNVDPALANSIRVGR